MSGSSTLRRRRRLLLLAAMATLTAAGLLAWLLFWPSPELLCSLTPLQTRPATPLSDLTFGSRPGRHALVVTSLRSMGQADQAGVHVGDELEAVNGRRVDGLVALQQALKIHHDPIVSVELRRANGRYAIELDAMVQACHDPKDTGRRG